MYGAALLAGRASFTGVGDCRSIYHKGRWCPGEVLPTKHYCTLIPTERVTEALTLQAIVLFAVGPGLGKPEKVALALCG